MKKEKLFHIISSVFLIMIANTMVNFSGNLYMGLKHPEIYFTIVIIGIALSIAIQMCGAYVMLGEINRRIND